MPKAINEVSEFCHSHGTVACWLMIQPSFVEQYRSQGLLIMPIGSSALVDAAKFTNTTVRGKWWRWKTNKALKSGLIYRAESPPHSADFLANLHKISNAWLGQNGHVERGFAMGYFDQKELAQQIIHAVYNEANELVAFANQLPTYNNQTVTTIDLMRYAAGYDDAVAFLLSCAIKQSHEVQGFKYFDLGFVPLANVAEGEIGKKAAKVLQKSIKPVFSASGLMQFKNKFEPDWQRNYVAVDGDLLTTTTAIANLPKALKISREH